MANCSRCKFLCCFCYCCCMTRARCCMCCRGLIMRFLFSMYSIGCVTLFITISLSVDATEDNYTEAAAHDTLIDTGLAFSAIAIAASFLESFVTLCCKKYGDWKKFSPCILIFLLGSIPPLFLLEWIFIGTRNDKFQECMDTSGGIDVCEEICSEKNVYESVLLGFEQTLVILLVIGRWFLPKGKISREILSDMLLAFIGMSADMLEFLKEGLGLPDFGCDRVKSGAVLAISIASLMQFTVNLAPFIGGSSETTAAKIKDSCSRPDVRTILMNMFLQDAPFFGMRMYILFSHERDDYQGLIFFAIKNGLVVMLQTYRLIILCNVKDEAALQALQANKGELVLVVH